MLRIVATKAFILFFLIACLTGHAEAQKRRAPTSKSSATIESSNTVELRQGAEKVSTQLINVAKFIYVLGGVAREIEQIDQKAKKGELSRAMIDKNEEFKQKVIQSIRDLRVGLASLEAEFRSNQNLGLYSTSLLGITEDCNLAEEQAISGNFVQSGRTLLTVIEKLTNTLVALSSAKCW